MLSETEYHRPTDIESACEMLSERPEAAVVAGGQSLGLLTKEGIITPTVLVDINEIEDLQDIERDSGELRLGATVTHRTIEKSDLVAEEIPVLQEAASHIADVQIRNAGTIGGVAAYADPTAEYPLVFLALDGTIVAQTVDGREEHKAREFFEGYYMSVLEGHELVTEVRLPVIDEYAGAGYEKLAYRENDRAVVNVVSYVETEDGNCTNASIAVGSVTDTPYLAKNAAQDLTDTDLNDDAIADVANLAKDEVPIDPDPSISIEYREDMVYNLVEDTLKQARTNALGDTQ